MKRNGYNIIELLVVITAIALITAIGYKGFNILFDKIKTEGLKTEISKAKTALANAQKVGSIYWGGDFVGVTRQDMEKISPKENAKTDDCNYYEMVDGSLQNNCKYDNIIYAERKLFKEMKIMEFRYVKESDGGGNFRSSRFPSSKIGFLPNINGFAGIVFSDIPGNIAAKVYESLNSPVWKPTKDGLTSERPVLIFPANVEVKNIGANMPSLPNSTSSSSASGTDTATGFKGLMPDIIESAPKTVAKGKELDYISSLPKVTLIYIYTYKTTKW